jgi:hypothetical protein
VLHDALTRAASVVMAFKYGAAAHSARDYPLIHAGGRSGKVGAYDLGMAYDEQRAGRPRDCLRAAAGVGLNYG